MNIGFDLDGVLVDWHNALLSELRCFGSFYNTMQDLILGMSSRKFDFFTSLPFLYTRPVPNKRDLEILDKIASKHEIFYITARPESARLSTENYLHRYKFPFSHNLIMVNGITKSNAINDNNIVLFLEDRPEFIEEILANSSGCLPVLFSREWNIGFNYSHTVSSVEEFFIRYVDKLE